MRLRSGSVLATAFPHGAYNGTIGFSTLSIIGGSLSISVPMGLLTALVVTAAAILVWRLPARTVPEAGAPELVVLGPCHGTGNVHQAESGSRKPAP